MSKRMTSKFCRMCKKTLPIAKFYRWTSYACGRPTGRYSALCRPHWGQRCNFIEFHKKSKQKPPKKLSDKKRGLRQRARHALGNAVYYGWVKKPAKCQRCKKKTRPLDLHGHHYKGYSKKYWRTVKWLCRICHNKETA